MRTPFLAGFAALAVTGGSLLSIAAPAQAADAAVLYVRQFSTACSNTGPGTLAEPFCAVAPAAAIVTAGQTIDVGPGTYRERVIVASSGTPEQPIVFRSSSSTGDAYLVGPTAGLTIDGQHDITIQRFQATGATELPALDLRNASGVTVDGGGFSVADGSTAPVIRLTGVTQSSITRSYVGGPRISDGVVLDEATSGVSLAAMTVNGAPSTSIAVRSVGIRIAGHDNMVRNNTIEGFTGAAISVESGSSGTVVVNNLVNDGFGGGIHHHGGTGTAITNNTVRGRCLDSIRVDGASSGVSVQNNLLRYDTVLGNKSCPGAPADAVEIGVYGDATRDTVVDYNNADHYVASSPTIYAWNAPMSMAAFRAASGQAAHDRETADPRAGYDSANSAAPGYPEKDRSGTARVDDPAMPNTGAGPVTYADRGAVETIRGPQARLAATLDLAAGSVTADASASEAGVAAIASYRFDFGDGTVVTQDTPVASHQYATRGSFGVSVQVVGTDGRKSSVSQPVSVLPRTGTLGLLTLSGLRYVGPMAAVPWPSLAADHPSLDATSQFDLADAGNGQVALLARTSGQYVTADTAGVAALNWQGTAVTINQRFTLVSNADGTISLKSAASGRYVTATANITTPLIANATTIGANQKFYRVNVADAGRSFKARANNRYVTAESAGVKPLIANRTSVGPWERFDLVDLGNGQIALFARADNRFVTAESAGAKPLIANRASVGAWERFTLVRNADGTASLKAGVNKRYVTAESAGTKPLIANRTSIGLWEKFTLGA
ncbi:PKD domain-containing protein [Micromonospora sp. RTP1Z1]|uniref:PKD domain-containing protein n=1 Tax=Micromonospora sp. RTP1Z1 TaxID=2994043 RepID=UPI0029C8B79A|nr:PKD domain-containing protein [Micromonospora sp. RTP1Z1]